MKTTSPKALSLRSCALAVAGLLLSMTSTTVWAADGLDDILSRVSARVADSLERFSETRCTEKVNQQKLSSDGKVERDTDAVTAAAGSPVFIVAHAVWFGGWITLNVRASIRSTRIRSAC